MSAIAFQKNVNARIKKNEEKCIKIIHIKDFCKIIKKVKTIATILMESSQKY